MRGGVTAIFMPLNTNAAFPAFTNYIQFDQMPRAEQATYLTGAFDDYIETMYGQSTLFVGCLPAQVVR